MTYSRLNQSTKTYDNVPHEHWMNGLEEMRAYNQRTILAAFAVLGIPPSYLDVGCGDGAMVDIAKTLGVDAIGIDQLNDGSIPHLVHQNLEKPFDLGRKFKIVTCFEVAEHIAADFHPDLCQSISNHVQGGDNSFLLFGAARPGQDGTGHVACRPAEYWHQRFIDGGMSYNRIVTMDLAHIWSNIGTPLNYFWDNLIVFQKA